ncbi:MAG: TetR/AcrR family transcriptional regulator [Chloroflexota bacterium]
MSDASHANANGESAAPPPRGRPRDTGADARVLRACVDLLTEVGAEGTTMAAVIERSGVARATVYRRWPNREALLIAALRELKGRGPVALSGDLETDIARSAEQARRILAEERFRSILPLLARDLVKGGRREGSATFHRVAPNHERLARIYEELAAKFGLRDDIDGQLVSDIVIGAQLARLLSTGRPPTKPMTDQLVEVLLAGLRVSKDV